MPRLRNATTRVVVNVDDDTAEWLRSEGWKPADDETTGGRYEDMKVADDETTGGRYEDMKVAELRAEIGRRNEGREEADRLPDDGRKADLIAVLTVDDE
jgi:hypothetical protein